jgi:biotin carboxyl carrier protein
MTAPLFRASSLERLSSPEQLDQLMPIISPKRWAALGAIIILLSAAVLWGILGTVTTTVEGEGILIRQDGVKRVLTPRSGLVRNVLVRPGDVIYSKAKLVQLDDRYPEQPPPPRSPRPGTDKGKAGANGKEDKEDSPDRPKFAANLDENYLTSNWSGRVLEVLVQEGSVIERGSLILTIEPLLTAHLEGLIYMPVADGHKVKPGMRVEFAPSTVKKNEFGYVLGSVTSVSRFPSSHQAIMRLLENEELVRSLTRDSPCLQISAQLIPDESTISGYKWSSSKGPPLELASGIPCKARVTVREQRPIRLVVPTIRDLLGF